MLGLGLLLTSARAFCAWVQASSREVAAEVRLAAVASRSSVLTEVVPPLMMIAAPLPDHWVLQSCPSVPASSTWLEEPGACG